MRERERLHGRIGRARSAVSTAKTSAAAAVLLACVTGCTTIRPAHLAGGPIVVHRPFSHEEFAPVLAQVVDATGRVDYAALTADAEALERYHFLLSRYSPDSHPDLFPTDNDRLAYWLNAHTTAVLKAVLAHAPIATVTDIAPPLPRFFLPRRSGFFRCQRIVLGGRATSLARLENRIIRKRFKDPRVHFALTWATRSSPPLRRVPFVATRLQEQLERATRRFLADPQNLAIDDETRTVHLSSIFDWYTNDFVKWYTQRFSGDEAALLHYVALYAPPEQVEAVRRARSYQVRFVPYDWRLNDRGAQP